MTDKDPVAVVVHTQPSPVTPKETWEKKTEGEVKKKDGDEAKETLLEIFDKTDEPFTYPNPVTYFAEQADREAKNRGLDMEPYTTPENTRDWLGVFTLMLLGGSGILGAIIYKDNAYWVQLPYYATIVGSWGGFFWEVFGDLNGRWKDTVNSWRSANVGIVAGSIFFLFFRIANYNNPSIAHKVLIVSTAGTFLFLNSFLGKQTWRGQIGSFAVFITCLFLGIFPSSQSLLSATDMKYMVGFAAGLIAAALALGIPDCRKKKPDPNLQDPPPPQPNLMLFHFINCIASLLSVRGLLSIKDAPPHEMLTGSQGGYIVLGIILGAAANFIGNPHAVAEALNIVSGFVWNLLLRFLLKQKPWEPTPLPPFQIQPKIVTAVYSSTHPNCAPLSCPSAKEIPQDQQRSMGFYSMMKLLFSIVDQLDFILPRARLVPLNSKPRLQKYQLSQYYWNPVLLQNVVPMETTPIEARAYNQEGQFLEYIVWFAHASNMIRKADEKKGETQHGTHVLDFDYLQQYQYKDDYVPYGGRAVFELKEDKKDEPRLWVKGVFAPKSDVFIPKVTKGLDAWRFRQVESLINACAFFEVVAGLHLMGIHVMMNTVPIALHNAFDTQDYKGQQAYHPFRVALNLHFFNHLFVNELTTAHLLATTSVFPQIFATTHTGLCHYLNDKYVNFEYGRDAKLEERVAVVDGKFPPTSQLAIELKFIQLYRDYGTSVVNAIYKDDREVQEDKQIQNFNTEMGLLLAKGRLPERYGELKTKEGLALFYAESVYVVSVRHQVYGNKATFTGLDPSIMIGQVPRDYAPDAVDVYNSVLWVGLATAQAHFAFLLQNFKPLLVRITDETVREGVERALDRFMQGMFTLQKKEHYDYSHLKCMPAQLDTGAGY